MPPDPHSGQAHMAMSHNLCLHFGADEHPFETDLDVNQGYRVLTHSHTVVSLARPSTCLHLRAPLAQVITARKPAEVEDGRSEVEERPRHIGIFAGSRLGGIRLWLKKPVPKWNPGK